MNPREEGYLLLCSPLGDPQRRVLTCAQLRNLGKAVRQSTCHEPDRELEVADLQALGYDMDMARRIYDLLQEQQRLEHYCIQGSRKGCHPLTQISGGYPRPVLDKLGLEGPGCIWYKGDATLLSRKAVALVGSRDLEGPNREFARLVGAQAALQGYALISGNARGADQEAQNACLEAGGQVISIVADGLVDKPYHDSILYISEDGYDLPFTAQRALSRNRLIHIMAQSTFVAQCGYQMGGTWSGTVRNLRFGWSPVYVYADGSPAQALLQDMGAQPIRETELLDIDALPQRQMYFYSVEAFV